MQHRHDLVPLRPLKQPLYPGQAPSGTARLPRRDAVAVRPFTLPLFLFPLLTSLTDVLSSSPRSDTLNSLPYLDACVREVLRLHAPVPGTDRRCTKTDTIPLSKPVMGKDGNLITELVMEEGVTISIREFRREDPLAVLSFFRSS